MKQPKKKPTYLTDGPAGTVTGRMSCSAPETQEFPGTPGHRMQQRSRTPLPKGFVELDYAELERRIAEADEEE